MFERIKKNFKRAKNVNDARKKVKQARATVRKYVPLGTKEIVGITCVLLAVYIARNPR